MNGNAHTTVLLTEAVDALMVNAEGIYIDGTYGRGGHSRALLARLSPQGRLLALDRDPQAIAHAQALQSQDARFAMVQRNFAELGDVLAERGLSGRVSGVLLDLGVSSPQLDDAARGFSFLQDGPLDMRMNPRAGISAAEWINSASADEMAAVFRDYGEERHARRIAQAIVTARASQPFERTLQFAEVVAAANPAWEKHKHPATRVFQAVRIFINDELGALRAALQAALAALCDGGRLAVISFHSLEDRIVKQFMREQARGQLLPRHIPVTGTPQGQTLKLVGKAIKPSEAEVTANPRARSAVLRVAEKLAVAESSRTGAVQ